MSEPDSTLPDRLRTAIERSGRTLREFSAQSGVPYRTLQNYLAGDRKPGAEALEQFCDAGLDINWLLTGRPLHIVDYDGDHPGVIFNVIMKEELEQGLDEITQRLHETGVYEFIIKKAVENTDKLNREFVEKNGESYSVISLVNSMQYFASEDLSRFKRAAAMMQSPDNEHPEIPYSAYCSVVESTLVHLLGDDAKAHIQAFLNHFRKDHSDS